MTPRLAAVVLVAVALGLAPGCAGEDEDPFEPAARLAADEFVLALVSDGNLDLAERHATGRAAEHLALWHEYLLRDGVQSVEGPGGVRGNCAKSYPVGAPREEGDCLVYRLIGRTPVPDTRDTLVVTARLRVWLEELEGTWKVSEFDYTPHLDTQ